MATGLRFVVSYVPSIVRYLACFGALAFLWGCSLYALTILFPSAYGLNRQAVDVLPAGARSAAKM